MALPANVFQAVQTYQESNLAYLLNHFAFINTCNKKFKNFDTIQANLGDTVTFDLPPRFSTVSSLTASFEAAEQRTQGLKVDKEVSTSYLFNSQQIIFNIENTSAAQKSYMDKFGASANEEIGTEIEADVAGLCESHTYRFFGNGSAINSYGQLASAMAFFRNYGAAKGTAKGFLDDLAVPGIVNTGLTQFVMKRNEEIANSWELGSFSKCDWLQSNLLPIHTAGTVCDAVTKLVVTAVTTDPDGGISAITCSGGGTDADAIKQYDLLQFDDSVSGQINVRYRTFIGHKPSGNPVQIQATANAASSTDSVTIQILPKLYNATGNKQNITTAITVGMKLTTLPTHRCGLIYSGNAMFLAMPQLPDQPPFDTWNTIDKDSGCSVRMTYGSRFGENEQGMVHDNIWGKTMPPEYAMRLVFPL